VDLNNTQTEIQKHVLDAIIHIQKNLKIKVGDFINNGKKK